MADTYHQNFFYDGQIRRFVQQFIRMVSNVYVEFGSEDSSSPTAIQRVPVMYGDPSRQAAQIIRNGSENSMSSVPAMSVYITSFDYDRARVQEPFHVSKMQIRQRRWNPATNEYDSEQFDNFNVERPMPVPYRLTLSLDIWTSNTEQKLQLLEQLSTLFNPSLEIQSTDNYIDWTSLSTVLLTNTRWDSRTVPMGGNNDISISTMTFELPIWISAPARVNRLGVIYKAINSVYDANGNINSSIIDDQTYIARRVTQPYGYAVMYSGNTVTLIKSNHVASINDSVLSNNAGANWKGLVELFGSLNDGLSEIRLISLAGDESILRVSYNTADPTQLIVSERVDDTFPANTISGGIDAIIDPYNKNIIDLMFDSSGNYAPGQNRDISRTGQNVRYLTLGNIGSGDNADSAEVWGGGENRNFIAEENDIIEYDLLTGRWRVVFDSSTENNLEYVTNLNTNIQYKWFDGQWTKSVEGIYQEGEWSIVL
jgi:hypothetical protein